MTDLVAGLFAWSLLSLTAGVVGLYQRPREWWRGAWFMTGLWGAVDGAIAVWALLAPLPAGRMVPVLKLNAGLDVGYIVAGVVLLTRSRSLVRGFGAAVVVQGLFLLAFDVYFWRRFAGG